MPPRLTVARLCLVALAAAAASAGARSAAPTPEGRPAPATASVAAGPDGALDLDGGGEQARAAVLRHDRYGAGLPGAALPWAVAGAPARGPAGPAAPAPRWALVPLPAGGAAPAAAGGPLGAEVAINLAGLRLGQQPAPAADRYALVLLDAAGNPTALFATGRIDMAEVAQ